jgi:hypothetical protein
MSLAASNVRESGRCIALPAILLVLILLPSQAIGQAQDYTQRQLFLDNITELRGRLIDTYKKMGNRNPAWDADALDFMGDFCRKLCYSNEIVPLWPDDMTKDAFSQLADEGARVLAEGCDDPQVTYCYGVVLSQLHRDKEAVAQLRQSFSAIKKGDYPPDSVMVTAGRLRAHSDLISPDELRELNDAIESSAVKMFSVRRPWKMDRYFAKELLKTYVETDYALETRVYDKVQQMPDADPWLAKIFGGEHEIKAAWESRGVGWGNQVAPQGWQGMADHLAKAQEFLTGAWAIDPTIPGPADDMITVAMGANQKEAMRVWYDRARQAMVDDGAAFQNMVYALYPRWLGSYDDMLALGMEAANTKRFDTQAPMWLMSVVNDIQMDSQGTSAYNFADPQIYRAMRAVFVGYENASPEGRAKDWYRSGHALLDWRAEKYDEARYLLDELGDRLDPTMFSELAPNWKLADSQVYAFTGPQADQVKAAASDTEGGDTERAAKEYADLAAAAAPEDKAAYYLHDCAANLSAKSQFDAGKWVNLVPNDDAIHLWTRQQGTWSYDAQHGLVGNWSSNGPLLIGTTDFGPSFEVTATLECQSPPEVVANCGIALDFIDNGFYDGFFFCSDRNEIVTYLNAKPSSKEVEVKAVNQLHVQYWDGRFTATFNGQPVEIAPTPDAERVRGATHLAIYSLAATGDTTISIKEFKVRKLDEKPGDMP